MQAIPLLKIDKQKILALLADLLSVEEKKEND